MAPWPQLAWNNRNTYNIDPGCTFPSGIVSPGDLYLHHRTVASTSQVPADIYGKYVNYKQAKGNVRRRFHGTSCSARCNFFVDLKVSKHDTHAISPCQTYQPSDTAGASKTTRRFERYRAKFKHFRP